MKHNILKGILQSAVWWMAGFLFLYSCTTTPVSEGGGSRGGNPVVIGTIIDTDKVNAYPIRVSLIPDNFNLFTDSLMSVTTVFTDSLGKFSITAPDSGMYNIQAYGNVTGSRVIHFTVKALYDSIITILPDTLHIPGTIRIALPEDIDLNNDYIYIPGTFIGKWVAEAGDTLVIDSVPPGIYSALCLGRKNSTLNKIIRHNVQVNSNQTTVIQYPEWSYCQKIILNTTESGANVNGNVYGFPVLIRLSDSNFDFSKAQKNGDDIRFTNSRGVFLSYEIEQWDSSSQCASIWVKTDTVYGNNKAQSLLMYWGNGTSGDSSSSSDVFDTSAGFQGVWHLNNDTGNLIKDATANGYDGILPDISFPETQSGIIGKCKSFDGNDDFITMPNTADSKLNFPENGFFSLSAWVNLDTLDSTPHLLAAKGYDQYFLRFTYFPAGTPVWEFSEFNTNGTWQTCTTTALSSQWSLITGIRMGSRQILYINGVAVDSTPNVYQAPGLTRDTSDDFSIGRFQHLITLPNDTEGYCFFRGALDEVRVDSKARNANWVKLCYMNQRKDNRLVFFK